MTNEELLREAVQIADGKWLKLGTTAHVKALVVLARELRESLDDCMDTVSIFHGPCGLSIYQSKSPEYQRWKAAISRAEVLRP
jgi:hypothetical protein